MVVAPIALILVLVIVVALVVPLIPMRRRQYGFTSFPYVTVGLLFANLVIFGATVDKDGQLSPYVSQHYGMIPHALTVVTLLTHMFLHGSWLHVLGNMLFLWLFGPHVEEALGKIEYLIFYIGCGIASGLLHLLLAITFLPAAEHSPLVGASGAIFGVMGLFAVRFWRTRIRVLLFLQVRAIWAVGVFAIIQVVLGLISLADGGATDHTANWAHVGGFLFGVLLAFPLKMREDSRVEYDREDADKAALTGNMDEAAAHYRAVLEATPADPDAHHALGKVLIQLRQGEAAHRHLMDALQLYLRANAPIKAAQVYADAVESFDNFPLPPALLQRVASACEVSEQYALTLRALSELCRDHPQAREAEMGLIRLGKLHLQKLHQPQNAVSIFSEFIRLYPHSEWTGHAERLLIEARGVADRSGGLSAPAAPPRPGA